MAFFIDNSGAPQHVEIEASVYKEALDAGVSVPTLINRKYASADLSHGSAFTQLCASVGLTLPNKNVFGIRPAIMADILDGKAGMQAAGPANVSDTPSPFGMSARSLAPTAIIELVEDMVAKDRVTDEVVFSQLVSQDISIDGDNFIQPVVSYQGIGGPEQAKAQRVSEFSEPGSFLRLSTAERIRSLPAFAMGIEVSAKAERSLTLDVVAASIARYVEVERDERVYGYLSALFVGDNDLVTGAIPSVTTASLDAAAAAGTLSHKAWVKFLARNRKKRTITHIVCDIDTYLKIEGRTGRPGTNNYDPSLARIDPQATPANAFNVGFGNGVKFFIVDSAVDGGPVPANTVWAIDANKAITRVNNSAASYAASEAFALRRSTAMRWDWSEAVYRKYGDTDLTPFDVLTIS
jgi:hypothetical protein